MYIYNTTFLVSHKIYAEWYIWLKEKYIPRMMKYDFTQPQIAKVHSDDVESEGTSISLQFHFDKLTILENWQEKHEQKFHKEMSIRFGQEVLFFPTVLEIL